MIEPTLNAVVFVMVSFLLVVILPRQRVGEIISDFVGLLFRYHAFLEPSVESSPTPRLRGTDELLTLLLAETERALLSSITQYTRN